MTPELESAVARNAQLAQRLRRTVAALHRLAPDHARYVCWTVCPHPACRAVALLFVERFFCDRCEGDFPLLRGMGRFCAACTARGALVERPA